MATSKIKAVLESSIDEVWKTVLNVENYRSWRSDLLKVEKINEGQFIEYTKKGYPTTFTVTQVDPCRYWAFDMENTNMKGHWVGIFTNKGNTTEIEFTEEVEAKKFFMRPFLKAFLRRQQRVFVEDLRKGVGECIYRESDNTGF
ncbi:MAG: SRPBCC family protein [Eubacterium sp.]|nr:SRPBCC family protein [Eubacterium sp.]